MTNEKIPDVVVYMVGKLVLLAAVVVIVVVALMGLWGRGGGKVPDSRDYCTIELKRVELRKVNATGLVYAPCNYTGKLLTEPEMTLPHFKCVAAGHAGGKLYAVFALEGGTTWGCSFPNDKLSEACYCQCRETNCSPTCAIPAVLVYVPLFAVVDVENGSALLTWRAVPYHNVSNWDVAFGDGVYLRSEHVRGTPEKVCHSGLVPNTAFKIRVHVDKSALSVGRPVGETGGVFVDATPR